MKSRIHILILLMGWQISASLPIWARPTAGDALKKADIPLEAPQKPEREIAMNPAPPIDAAGWAEKHGMTIREMIRFETSRLGNRPEANKIAIEFPEKSEAFQKISDLLKSENPKEVFTENSLTFAQLVKFLNLYDKKKSEGKDILGDSEMKQLLAVMRASNLMSRGGASDLPSAFKTSILDDLSGPGSRQAGNFTPNLSPEVGSALEKEAERLQKENKDLLGTLKGGLTLKKIKDLIQNPFFNKDALTPKQWSDLAGSVRSQVPDFKGDSTLEGMKADILQDFLKDGNPTQSQTDQIHALLDQLKTDPNGLDDVIKSLNQRPPFDNPQLNPPQPKGDQGGGHSPNSGGGGGPQGGGKSGGGRPQAGGTPGGGPSGGGSGTGLSGPGLSSGIDFQGPSFEELAARDRDQLKGINPGTSFVFESFYKDVPGSSICQGTFIDQKKVDEGRNMCVFVAATARHCVRHTAENGQETGRALQGAGIKGMPQAQITETALSPDNSDMALMKVYAPCNAPYPVVKLATNPPQSFQPIAAQTRGRGVLVGRAYPYNRQGQMLMDLREGVNQGGRIIEGDSGGALLTLGADGSEVLSGVISARFIDPSLNPFGITATSQTAMSWANQKSEEWISNSGPIQIASR